MKKLKITFIIGMMISIIMALTSVVKAESLTITPSASSSTVKKGENVTITVRWSKAMEAADYVLNYDSSKMQFVSASIESSYYSVGSGKVKVAWASLDGNSLSSMSFTFKALVDSGSASFNVSIDGGFSDGNLVRPDSYNTNATATVNLTGSTSGDSSEQETSGGESSDASTAGGESSDASTAGQSATNPQTTPSKLPHAGKENLVILFIGVGAMAAFSFYKMNKYKKF